jgi:SAM-dependent methyltransferase
LNVENSEIINADYPEYDVLNLPFPDNHFDYVANDQILEHVEGNPQQAIDEICRVLKPGGIAVHTTCFINPIHELPKDFWRFSPDGLALLCKKFSKIVDIGGWGNWWVWFMAWLDLKFYPIPHAGWHPLHKMAIRNDNQWPVVTWIIVQK